MDEKLLWAAFMAGFRSSGEGWNGEMLFNSNPMLNPSVKEWGVLKEDFKKFLQEERT